MSQPAHHPSGATRTAVALAARLACVLAALASAQAAWAQTAPPPGAAPADAAQADASQTITVTARKREERGQDVPQSLNVFSGAALENSGVTQLEELQYRTPGLKVINGLGTATVSIRGVSNNASSRGGSPSAAVHLDGVYLPRPVLALSEFFDLDRIEVLKGPEGTLYGRNATAGVINYLTRDPKAGQTFDGFVGGGSYGLKRAQAGVTVGLGEGSALRISGVSTRDDGYTENIGTGGGEVDSRNFKALRLKGIFALTPSVQLKLTVQDVDNQGTQGIGASHNPQTTKAFVYQSGAPLRESERRINLDTPLSLKSKGTVVSAALSADLGRDIEFKSITGYVDYRSSWQVDADGTGGFIENSESGDNSRLVSQEFQLSGRLGPSLSWTSGAYFSRERTSGRSYIYDSAFYPDDLTPVTFLLANYGTKTRSTAVFGEATWQFAEKTALLLGVRQSWEKQQADTAGVLLNFTTFRANPFSDKLALSTSNFTPKLMLQHRLHKDAMVYGSFTTGFKSGGFNLTPATQTYRPEKIKALEVGTKLSAAAGRLELDAAAFYYDYTELQLRTADPVTFGVRVSNVAKASIKGMEFTLVGRPSRDLRLDLNASYVDSTLKNFISPVSRRDLSGTALPTTPRASATAGAEYRLALGGGSLTLRGEVNHQSTVVFPSFINPSFERQGPVTLVNANLRYDLPGRKTWVSVIGRNLADKTYLSNRVYYAGFYDLESYAPPRTFEVRVGTKF